MKFLIVVIATFILSATGFAQSVHQSHHSDWKIVPSKEVCMVTETHFTRPQIPVQVEGKTYYGCCDNCKKTLSESKGSRTAKDALTGKSIDKARATIAANSAGNVLYFENKKNFEKFLKGK